MHKKIMTVIAFLIGIPLLTAGIWAADYFLIPKVERTGITAPKRLPAADSRTEEAVPPSNTANAINDTNNTGNADNTNDTGNTDDTNDAGNADDTFPVMTDHFPEEILDQPVAAGDGSEDDPESTTVLDASDDGINRIVVTKTVMGTGEDKVTCYVADLSVKDARELKTCFAQDAFGENIYEKISSMAERCQAVFAVNGDCYGWRDNGIIIRNGELFRDDPARIGMALYEDGRMQCYEETSTTGQDMISGHAWITFSFGPQLVQNGEVTEGLGKEDRYTVDLTEISHHSPRTAIGKIADNHFLFVVVDGRQPGYSKGMYLNELADFMKQAGCQEAYNLDGGASAAMYFKGQIVNHPCSASGERKVSDCIFIN